MTEHDIQARAVGYLRKAGVRFFAVPNGGLRDQRTAVRLWQEGVEAGVPDLIVVDPPPLAPSAVGAVLEVKTCKGRLSDEQRRWLDDFKARGWEAQVVHGLQGLLSALCALGYLDAGVMQREGLEGPHGAADGGSTARCGPAAAPPRTAAARTRPIAAQPSRPTRGRRGAA